MAVAVFIENDIANSYKFHTTGETYGKDFLIFETLPEIFNQDLSGHIVKYDGDAFYLEPIYMPKDRLQLLEEENADLKSRLGDVELFLADIIGGI